MKAFIAVLKNESDGIIFFFEISRIDLENSLHKLRKLFCYYGLYEQMKMIGHQAVVEDIDLEHIQSFLNNIKNMIIVIITAKDLFSIIASGKDMVVSQIQQIS
jgi:hypothetical protein